MLPWGARVTWYPGQSKAMERKGKASKANESKAEAKGEKGGSGKGPIPIPDSVPNRILDYRQAFFECLERGKGGEFSRMSRERAMGKGNSDASSDSSPTPAQSLGLRLATESAFQLPLEGGKSSGGGKGPTGAEKSSALPPDWYVSQVPLDDNSHLKGLQGKGEAEGKALAPKGKAQDKGKGKSNCDARHVTCYPRAGVSHVTLGRACHM